MKLCIVGTGRCGTTLLWRMLNCHPDLFVYRETHWLPALHERFGTLAADTDQLIDIVQRTRFVTEEPTTGLDAIAFRNSPFFRPRMTVREFSDGLGQFFANAVGKSNWADKTPDYGYFVSLLQMYWPECRIIHVIRDGVSTAASMSGHIGFQAMAALQRTHWCPLALDFQPPPEGFAAAPAERYPGLWYDRLRRIRDEAERLRPGSYIETRYEDLRRAPRAELARLAGFAGLRDDETWLTQASCCVDPNRGGPSPAHDRMRRHFKAPHLQLLADLGYAVEI